MSKYTWIDFSATATGVDGVAMNASTNMSPIAIQGADLVELNIMIVNATAAALDLTGTLQQRRMVGMAAGTMYNWDTMQTRAIAAGVETWSDRTLAKTTPAVATTYYYRIPIDDIGPADEFRISSLTASAAGATDLLTITARVRIGV